MFLNFLIFLFIFVVLYSCYVYLEVNFRLKDILGKDKYKSLKSFQSKVKLYNQKVWHKSVFNTDFISRVMILSGLIYSILFFQHIMKRVLNY